MVSNTSRRRLLTYSGLLALGLAGCLDEQAGTEDDDHHGDDHDHDDGQSHDNHSHDHEVGNPESEIEVEMVTNDEGQHFIPHVVHIKEGGTVDWVVESGSHDTTAYHPDTHGDQQRIPDEAEPWESGLLSDEGEAFERTFDHEGVYDYVCTPHEGNGMVGTVVVGWPDPDGQPGLQSPTDDRPDDAIEQLERYNGQVRDVLEKSDEDNHREEDDHDDHDH